VASESHVPYAINEQRALPQRHPPIIRSQPINAIIPHDVPELVYNTRYYGRDYRRNNKYSARTVDRTPLDVDRMLASMPLTPEDIKFAPRKCVGAVAGWDAESGGGFVFCRQFLVCTRGLAPSPHYPTTPNATNTTAINPNPNQHRASNHQESWNLRRAVDCATDLFSPSLIQCSFVPVVVVFVIVLYLSLSCNDALCRLRGEIGWAFRGIWRVGTGPCGRWGALSFCSTRAPQQTQLLVIHVSTQLFQTSPHV